MSFRESIDATSRGSRAPVMTKYASTEEAIAFDKLADLMDKYASIIDGGEDQDVATQQVLSAIMDDGMTGDKAKKIEAIRNALQDTGAI